MDLQCANIVKITTDKSTTVHILSRKVILILLSLQKISRKILETSKITKKAEIFCLTAGLFKYD